MLKIPLTRNQIAGIVGILALTASFVFPSIAPIVSGLSSGIQSGFVDTPLGNVTVTPTEARFGCSHIAIKE